ncbi:MAG: hypothetical protein QXD14_07395 [Sulfolobales archaeon]
MGAPDFDRVLEQEEVYKPIADSQKNENWKEEALSFLEKVWSYISSDARYFTLVRISGKRVRYGFIEAADPATTRRQILAALMSIKRELDLGESIYFQVLPLSRKPEKGRGTAADVKVGKWLWADIDYKREVSEGAPFTKEGEDYSLEALYEEGGKLIRVERPPLKLVLKEVEEATGLVPSLVVDSGCGYHLYFMLTQEIEAKRLQRLESWLIDTLQKSGISVDTKSKDLARILRLPGFVNPRVNRLVRVIWTFPAAVDPELLEKRIAEELKQIEATSFTAAAQIPGRYERQLWELSDALILRIVELVKPAYKPGYRQLLCLYLSGFLLKSRVSPLSACKIVKILHETTNDGDPLKMRLAAVVYTYKKGGVDVDAYAKEIEALTGVRPYGLEREISEAAVKGKSGLQEILEEVLGEEQALAVIHELTEILRTASPYRDSIIELVDSKRRLYVVSNLRKLVMARMERTEKGFVYREIVAPVAPTQVILYDNPIGGIRKFEVVFEGQSLTRPLRIGPAYVEEIADRLRLEGLVYHTRLLNDTLHAVLNAYVKKGRAEVRSEIEAPGFYIIDGKLVTVKFDASYSKERLREALLLLNELADVWFAHARERFATIMKWGAEAPFSFILKQQKQKGEGVSWLPWLYLYGDPGSGKTTLGKIVLRIWGLESTHEKTGGNIDTVARIGHVLSMGTFPILVIEPRGALMKEDVVEIIKSAVESTVARGKYVKGSYIEYPALAPLILTSNTYLPRDDALLRRFIVINFTYGDKIPPARVKDFEEKVEPRLQILSEIGKCIATLVKEHPELLKGERLKVGENLLAMCYIEAGLPVPEWLNLTYETHEDYGELIMEEFIERLKKLVNDLYSKYIQKLVVEKRDATQEVVGREGTTLQERALVLLKANMLPGVSLKDETVLIKRGLLEELGMGERLTLKSLAEILKMEYRKYSERSQGVVKCNAAVIAPLDQFLELFID